MSPESGTALTTNFEMQCLNWIDDASDLPLSYEFSYRVGASAPVVLAATDALSLVSGLPPGDSEGDDA